MSGDGLHRKGKLHSRGAPGMEGSARKPQTSTLGSVYHASGSDSDAVLTREGYNGDLQSSTRSGYSSRRQILADMYQLDVVTGAAQDEEFSSTPESNIQRNRSQSLVGAQTPGTELVPAILGIAGQKNLRHPDSTAETSSDDTSESDVIRKDTPASNASCSLKRIAIVSVILLLITGATGGIAYYTMISRSKENSAIIGTPTQSPKEAGNQPEAILTAPPSPLPLIIRPEVPTAHSGETPKPPVQESMSPSLARSSPPSLLATLSPSMPLITTPVFPKIDLGGSQEQVVTFYAIGDVPYTPQQAVEIEVQVKNIPSDAEFVIHVGDLRNYDEANPLCREEEFVLAAKIFKKSPVPVFVIIGDNEWIDCSNPTEGLEFWNKHFLRFDSRHWNHTFDVVRQPGRPYNFAFVHKKTLFIGLNIVGVPVHDAREWEVRLTEQVQWTKELIRYYSSTIGETGRVVIFGHANPGSAHYHFFGPLDEFISQELNNQIPILYLNGDKHEWSYDPSFGGQESLLRIMVTGGSSEPPLKVKVVANGKATSTPRAFVHDRRL